MVTLVSNSLLGEELLSAPSPPPCTGQPMWAAEMLGSVAKEGPPSTERQAGLQGQTRSLQCILPSTPESSPLSCPQDGSSFGLDVSRVGGDLPCPASYHPQAGEAGGRAWLPHRPFTPRSKCPATFISCPRT